MARDAGRGDLFADGGKQLVRHAADRGAADDRRDRDHPVARRFDRTADAGHREDGVDRGDRIGRADDDAIGLLDGLEDSRRRPRRVGADVADRQHPVPRLASDPVLLEVEIPLAAGFVDHAQPRRHGVIGHRQQAGRDAEPPRELRRRRRVRKDSSARPHPRSRSIAPASQ